MNAAVKKVLVAVASFVAGAPVAFFIGGASFFADGPLVERYLGLAISAGILFALALAGGALAPEHTRVVAIWLVAPLLAVELVFVEWDKPEMVVLALAFLAGDLAAAFAGATLGARLRGRLQARG